LVLMHSSMQRGIDWWLAGHREDALQLWCASLPHQLQGACAAVEQHWQQLKPGQTEDCRAKPTPLFSQAKFLLTQAELAWVVARFVAVTDMNLAQPFVDFAHAHGMREGGLEPPQACAH